jgi:hypothetical protein
MICVTHFRKKQALIPMLQKWTLASTGFFILSILLGLIAVMALNGGVVNHLLTPVFQYTSLFGILWDEKPMGALQFIVTKSVIAFAHKDPRSGLNLWTYEFDTISLFVYLVGALAAGYFLHTALTGGKVFKARSLWLGLAGCALVLASVSYMTSIEHCSGATWVGFVAMYGMGFDEFELYPAWQWATAVLGLTCLAAAAYAVRQERGTQSPSI